MKITFDTENQGDRHYILYKNKEEWLEFLDRLYSSYKYVPFNTPISFPCLAINTGAHYTATNKQLHYSFIYNFTIEKPVINIYHAGFLPNGIELNKLHRWWGVYLHGKAVAPNYNIDAPDLFYSDIPFKEVKDSSYILVKLHINENTKAGLAFIWSKADSDNVTHRKGLIVNFGDDEAIDEAVKLYNEKSLFI